MIYNKIHKKTRTKKTRTKKTRTNKSLPKTINVLSYNISWESMTGKVSDWKLCSNNTDKKHPKHYSVCVNNIANVINEYEQSTDTLDFITLQEATDFYKLIEQSPVLKSMNYETHKSGLDDMVTFWKPKYKLLYTIKGEFEKGRPWLATLFYSDKSSNNTNNSSNNTHSILCVINVHMGHYSKNEEYLKLDKMIFKIKEEIKQNENQTININLIRYIISGDFNYNIKEFGNSQHKIIINETPFYHHQKHILTCCINRKKHNDHVIDSLYKPSDIQIPKVNYMASDHKPIIVKLVL